jgi:hypothetical protein
MSHRAVLYVVKHCECPAGGGFYACSDFIPSTAVESRVNIFEKMNYKYTYLF